MGVSWSRRRTYRILYLINTSKHSLPLSTLICHPILQLELSSWGGHILRQWEKCKSERRFVFSTLEVRSRIQTQQFPKNLRWHFLFDASCLTLAFRWLGRNYSDLKDDACGSKLKWFISSTKRQGLQLCIRRTCSRGKHVTNSALRCSVCTRSYAQRTEGQWRHLPRLNADERSNAIVKTGA